jgi:glycosyltransferase involved in cell wall biosynthesis
MGSFLKRTRGDDSKIVIIPGNIGPPRCTPQWQNKNASTKLEKLVYVGSHAPNKGARELILALGVLKERGYGNLRCSILAHTDGTEPAVTLARKLHIDEMVIFEGYKDPFPFLASSDLMVYPVLYDAYPDTILEALHTGCPVIASSVGGLPDMLNFPELLFEPGNSVEIADRIERCIKDISFYQKLRELCAERAAFHHFDWAGKFETAMKGFVL